ncbi:MAG: type II secretion system protein [Betaproteobacteria bacterium]|nr:type II secretion system protein [Betaproteobacteria bacterium]
MKSHRQPGFTLIELVFVMIIISVGLVGLISLFSSSATSLSTNETLQKATQYAQECAEKLMSTRRSNGFSWFETNTFNCSNPFTTTVTGNGATDTYTSTTGVGANGVCNGHSPCPCPTGLTCRDIGIEVRSGSLYSSITVMLVNY